MPWYSWALIGSAVFVACVFAWNWLHENYGGKANDDPSPDEEWRKT
jgi:hypothetical protein